MNRRKFLANTSLTATGIILGSNMAGCSSGKEQVVSSYDIMKDVMKYRKIDSHAHPDVDLEKQLEIADRLGIEKLQISKPITNFSGNEPEGPEEAVKNNNIVLNAVKKYPDRFIGFFTLNPLFNRESMEEIKRCADMGMAGFKGYTQAKLNDPVYYPIIEKLIDYKMIVYMHTFCQLGMGGYRMKYDVGRFANTTLPEDMVDAAKRYPEAIFHFAHIGGGADWEYECKILKECPNIYVDTGGSNNEENIVDFAIRHLGDERIFFGTDGAYHHGVGRVLASNATEEQKKKIFFDNYNNVLKKGGHHVA
ncbi:MAG: amidohydrolase [Bacteroidetes bacterium GWE2_41_25]|nr:MAG: amidohydrolase [Bacteroidetes bacterium GWA2_40_15]OFX93692.1 MAG: amidohydrolase [Bacteroidetes bacterium GWC2_40_22]OFY01658.1 MAG: amidohydrolase [Bacteroidetes bacterium GWE2_41_25]OFY60406.1 MAG: amidohydrolase [Bacteroidetes bacterium GWF2_41_9]